MIHAAGVDVTKDTARADEVIYVSAREWLRDSIALQAGVLGVSCQQGRMRSVCKKGVAGARFPVCFANNIKKGGGGPMQIPRD